MLDVAARGQDVRCFVRALESWVIAALAEFNVTGVIRPGRVGVWVTRPDKPPLPDGTPREDKIAAIGIKLRRWVSFHGISINVEPDLGHFDGIVPCGIRGHGVTSLVDLGLPVGMADLDAALMRGFGPAMAKLSEIAQHPEHNIVKFRKVSDGSRRRQRHARPQSGPWPRSFELQYPSRYCVLRICAGRAPQQRTGRAVEARPAGPHFMLTILNDPDRKPLGLAILRR
jgi:hypothetical protein